MKKIRTAVVGWVFTRWIWPLAKRTIRKKTVGAATSTASAGAAAVRKNPLKLSAAVGAAVGAVWYLVGKRGDEEDSSGKKK